MPVIKKVQSKIAVSAKKEEPVKEDSRKVRGSADNLKEDSARKEGARPKKVCAFCKSKTEPKYWDAQVLRRYLNDRGRIYLRTRTGTCSKHQRRVSREIKRARYLSLLPFTVRV